MRAFLGGAKTTMPGRIRAPTVCQINGRNRLHAPGRLGRDGIATGLFGRTKREQVEQAFLLTPFVAIFLFQALLQETQVGRSAILLEVVAHVVDDLPVVLTQLKLVLLREI